MINVKSDFLAQAYDLEFIGDLTCLLENNANNDDKKLKFSKSEIVKIQKKLNDETWKKEIGYCPCPDVLSATSLGRWRDDRVDVVPLRLNNDKTKVAELQMIKGVNQMPKIIMILESPHKEEYSPIWCSTMRNCGFCSTPVPVRGATGKAIKQYLPKMFDVHFDDYFVALINPIQYQCSLGLDDKDLKNKIFWSLFSKSEYLISIIRRIWTVYNPEQDIIVICCTGGIKGRNLIYNALRNPIAPKLALDLRCVLMTAHPSSWSRSCHKRKIYIKQDGFTDEVQNESFSEKDYGKLYQRLSIGNK